ncbi:MAG: filamentous hemagglutinin family protein [Rhodoplanes sp.]|uniref:filamentous haemagglutinin family protein n=1 Tax=Rhodoplanes sp. TaxID=1968906 RepID=UPI0017E4B5D6|nr:filamentous haemagglutinin family protein [Rhodoplanes sp.]NVO17643.1 filamentous hemagglutinin family protein [Rhodoplanes sp.]
MASHRSGGRSRLGLLAGVSVAALLVASVGAMAGDLHAGRVNATTAATNAATAAAQAAATASSQAMTQINSSLQAMRDAQAAARAVAAAQADSPVPNGTAPGGLRPVANPNSTTDGLTLWTGANLPVETSKSDGRISVEVKQTQERAILSWDSFNVGRQTDLYFNQSAGTDSSGANAWIALNRVVGSAASPSQILGTIKAEGTVLVINQNGIIFGAGSQVNVHSLIASTLDVGRFQNDTTHAAWSTAQRNASFLTYGLLGDTTTQWTFSGQRTAASQVVATGKVEVEAGASLTAGDGGYILLTAPSVRNSGYLSATNGQVILAAGDTLSLAAATGASDSADPGLRGLTAVAGFGSTALPRVVENTASGVIESPRGSIIISVGINNTSASGSVALVNGTLVATTSVSRNGAIEISGSTIDIAPGARLGILPDGSGETLPQDATSISNFKASQILIGNLSSRSASVSAAAIHVEGDTLIYAPSGNITIGATSSATGTASNSDFARVVVESGAVIDASGLTNVKVSVASQQITIGPLKKNELADSSLYRDSFLNGATVTIDPTLSGVRDDGVAWIGSPLIDAKSYYEQVGVSVRQLMTKGGNVTIGAGSFSNVNGYTTNSNGDRVPIILPASMAPYVAVKSGAVINVSGGWLSYDQGWIKTTKLISADGRVVDIGSADINTTYVGIYNGTEIRHAHWNVVEQYESRMRTGLHLVGGYTEGRDAGALSIVAPALVFEGAVTADAFAGSRQKTQAKVGTATSSIYGDSRKLQAASSQLPSGGALIIQGLATSNTSAAQYYFESGDIRVVRDQDYHAVSGSLGFGQVVTSANGTVTISSRDSSSYLDPARVGTVLLSDRLLSQSGFAEVAFSTTGSVSVAQGAKVDLAAGGVFDVFAGHRITIDGQVSVPSGRITLETFDSQLIPKLGFSAETYGVGSFDITVNGTLSTKGQWTNDFGATGDAVQGKAYLDGGAITLYVAPRVTLDEVVTSGQATPASATDISGSIRINAGATIDVSSGGYVDPNGKLVLTAKGGDLSLYNTTTYFPLSGGSAGQGGTLSGFRVNGLVYGNPATGYFPVNPDAITSGVFIDAAATIKANGFGGGGTFTLVTPEFAFSDDKSRKAGPNATRLPMDFVSKAGFANYKITSYKTRLVPNTFQFQTTIAQKTYVSTYYMNDYGTLVALQFDTSSNQYYYYSAGDDWTYYIPASQLQYYYPVDAQGNLLTYDPNYNSGRGGFYSAVQVPVTARPGGTNALLDTQTLTVGAGQTLNLTQSVFSSRLDTAQAAALKTLASGGDLYSVLTPAVPVNAWDAKPVNLTLGGLMELHVAQGGRVSAAAGASLTVAKLLNDGTIRLPGGSLVQQSFLPTLYEPYDISGSSTKVIPLGIRDLSQIFSVNADGSITSEATSRYASNLTNAQLAGAGTSTNSYPIYFVGLLDANQGMVLSAGSVTDVSGVSIRNPYSYDRATGQTGFTGRIVAGGSIVTSPRATTSQMLFQLPRGTALGGVYGALVTSFSVELGVTIIPGVTAAQSGNTLTIASGATVDLSGASDTYLVTGPAGTGLRSPGLVASAVWSDAGTLSAGAGFTISGSADIRAFGGAPQAENGTLSLLDPVLVQHDSLTPIANRISADTIARSGFDTLIAVGSLSSSGDVAVDLGRALFVTSRNYVLTGTANYNATTTAYQDDDLVPTVKAGGNLVVNVPYVGLLSSIDTIKNPALGTAGRGSVTFNAGSIDITGAVLFDKSVATATLNATGDVRLIGEQPWMPPGTTSQTQLYTLNGALAANGDLTINAGQVYPTTGSSFAITSANANGTIRFGRSGADVPSAPYSAGASLTVAAAHIIQGGILRVPLGTLTLGTTATYFGIGGASTTFAPATADLTLAAGGITSVSANGLSIPYGTTTDTLEWYFSPTNNSPLTAAPAKTLVLNGATISVKAGASVDLTGGGDVYAYEFVPGTGGSRDVLDRLNADTYTGNNGYQYPDGRQVYAIVPGLSNAPAAAVDPIYSSGYSSLYATSSVGKRVYLDGGQGLAAGWYTLLPAKYAMLPGGMAVVEQAGSTTVSPGTSTVLPTGTLLVTGHYGDAVSGASSSATSLFRVLPQSTVQTQSKIVLTTGNAYFAQQAADNNAQAARLPVDAGYMQINAATSLTIDSVLSTAAASGGRGALVDVGGSKITVTASAGQAVAGDGRLYVTADSLSNLNAASLMIGGIRTDNTDGTTAINVTAQSVRISNAASAPLSADEILLVGSSSVTVDDGSVLTAKGTLTDPRTGAYLIGSSSVAGAGALLRLANGPQRLVQRTNASGTASLSVGKAQFNGSVLLFDSSGSNVISDGIGLSGTKYLAISAPRIGIGVDPTHYSGTVASAGLADLLGRLGAVLTLRSQTAIDIAGGSYSFGKLALDAHTLASADGGAATITADTIMLGNTGNSADCTTCTASNGSLTLSANTILFTGGRIETKASIVASAIQATLTSDLTITLPAGASVYYYTLFEPTQFVIPAGTVVQLAGGASIASSAIASGTLATDADVIFSAATLSIATGSYYFPNGFKYANGASYGNQAAGSFSFTTAFNIPFNADFHARLVADTPITQTDFFAGGVTLAATNGIFAQGAAAQLDTGLGALTLHTPYLGDNVAGLASPKAPTLSLKTLGALRIDAQGSGAVAAVTAIPGGTLSLEGDTVSIARTAVKLTAGNLTIAAANGVALADGAVVATPGYTKTFGDAADPVTQDAPGGWLSITSAHGNIDLGAGTLVSVGGTAGMGGTLKLGASNGTVTFGGTIDGTAPGGAASFTLDTAGAFDLSLLAGVAGNRGFNGDIVIRTRTGDLVLAQGQTLKAASLSLTGDGGMVSIAGSVDTSGTNGGAVSLYGAGGVYLASTAVIDAHADGYGVWDSRQAEAGDVTLGTIGSGAVAIAAGAVIDVSAKNTADRVVPYYTNSVKNYLFVEGDLGGRVILRAPVVNSAGRDSVNVSVANAGSIKGAREIDLVGVKSFDLRALGAIAGSGVTIDAATNTAVIDPRGDYFANAAQAGSLVPVIQNFDVSASYGTLGGLNASSAFHAKPGVDLGFDGNVRLDRNWNLAAGTVDVARATAAGLMGSETFTGAGGSSVTLPYILPGKDAALFAGGYVSMLYRTGGSVYGEAPVFALKASGDLTINASISDGFFQFRNQTDANYLAAVVSTGSIVVAFSSGSSNLTTQVTTGVPAVAVNNSRATTISLSGTNAPATIYVPYSADGNSVSPEKSGDPFGSAVLFPALGTKTYADSTSLDLVAGAALTRTGGGALAASANPLATTPDTASMLAIGGSYSYSYGGSIVTVRYGTKFNQTDNTTYSASNYATSTATSANWLAAVLASKTTDTYSYTGQTLYYGTDRRSGVLLPNTAAAKTIDNQSDLIYLDFSVDTQTGSGASSPLANFSAVRLRDIAKISDPSNPKYDAYLHALYVSNASSADASGDFFTAVTSSSATDPYTMASGGGIVVSVKTAAYIFQKYVDPLFSSTYGQKTEIVTSLVRSGVGSINLASGGSVDLTGGALTLQTVYNYNNATQGSPVTLGGAAVYTAGHVADTSVRTAVDPETNRTVTIDPTAFLKTGTLFGSTANYGYGSRIAGTSGFASGAVGVLVSDNVYAEGGGDVSITAEGSVLARRDQSVTSNLAAQISSTLSFAGGSDEPWRVGAIGTDTWAKIDPQLFRSGVATLGGGDISIRAGGDILGLTVVATDSLTTARTASAGVTSKALMTFGRGDVMLSSSGSISNLRLDVASGAGLVQAAGGLVSAGTDANLLRLTDATVRFDVLGAVSLGGVAGVGPTQLSNASNNLNADVFYLPNSSISVLADGAVTLGYSANAPSSYTRGVLPGSLSLVSLTDSLSFGQQVLMMPSPTGELELLAGGSITAGNIAMLDADLGLLPGLYTAYDGVTALPATGSPVGTIALEFPYVSPTTTEQQRSLNHKAVATHADDSEPVRIAAGTDIGTSSGALILSVPKQARISAGRDIVNMIFYGQNLSSTDITRVTAGRDIIGTSQILAVNNLLGATGTAQPTLLGNTFVIGGPGDFVIEAGRNLGPFMPSAVIKSSTTTTSAYGGGILSVGNELNPWLPKQGASLAVMFGVAGGANYDGFRDYYLDPANLAQLPNYLLADDGAASVYGTELIAWMRAKWPTSLPQGAVNVTYDQAYAAFKALPEISQRLFLDKIYFGELVAAAIPDGPSYQKYARGYEAVNLLFPAAWGYTKNSLEGGANGAATTVRTGNLDLRLSTIQTARGGDISILGPGGRVLAGSVVRTAAQAARHNYAIYNTGGRYTFPILSIPTGYEGILTLRGGAISTFTDGDFVLNQSRLFTEQGGDIIMWSSNGDLNAGQGPKTSANFPPVRVRVSPNTYAEPDQVGATTGAGIAALKATPDTPASDIYLMAPRGTVDAGDAGIRSTGNLSIVAYQIRNADNIQVGGRVSGLQVQPPAATPLAAPTKDKAASDAVDAASRQGTPSERPSVIIVEILGYGGGEGTPSDSAPVRREEEERRPSGRQSYDPGAPVQVVGFGALTAEQARQLTPAEFGRIGR